MKQKEILYKTRINKAGALIEDTNVILSHWDLSRSDKENLELVNKENLLGKVSRSRIGYISRAFRQRYIESDNVVKPLVRLVQGSCGSNVLNLILYFHTMRTDALLRDLFLEVLSKKWFYGLANIEVNDIQLALKTWIKEGRCPDNWADVTVHRLAVGVLSTFRDFGILKGAAKKQISPPNLPLGAFAYIAFYLKEKNPSGMKFLELNDWKYFFLSTDAIERFLAEAHSANCLNTILREALLG